MTHWLGTIGSRSRGADLDLLIHVTSQALCICLELWLQREQRKKDLGVGGCGFQPHENMGPPPQVEVEPLSQMPR